MAIILQNLKEAKKSYLLLKQSHQLARDRCVLKEEDPAAEVKSLEHVRKWNQSRACAKSILLNVDWILSPR